MKRTATTKGAAGSKRTGLVGGLCIGLAIFATTALAAKPPAPKATGDIGYTAYSTVQRQFVFNAHQTWTTCAAYWDLTGAWKFDFTYLGNYAATYEGALTQSAMSLTGVFGYPPSASTYSYTLTFGNDSAVSNNTFVLHGTYASPNDPAAASSEMYITGTIGADGKLTGTWSDDYPNGTGDRTGGFSTNTGAAQSVVVGCTGKGQASYSDAAGNWYSVDVQFVQVSGDDTWFAGPVTAGNVGLGSWLIVKVHDGGESGIGVDQVWGSFTTQAAAMADVQLMIDPSDGPFTISSGNLQVH